MNSTQHNESLEGVLGEKRPGRGGGTPVWTSEEPQESSEKLHLAATGVLATM